eukprot:CAMPEP_0196746952 /NCGR_PEP_ID=MMETSP1091-20130531/67714_1 /TAXON_ID=302021 /ORGANISM="Rhodomonas sp., Strain CCMP768" /LENGTH=135 /DNA_ID=CAMNT_0042094001 /DNA_START=187 /DNA_END=594 /DNA_ORIENTATION=+
MRGLSMSSTDGIVEEVDAERLELAVQDSSDPLVVDFFTTWCGPCRLLEPQLKMAALDMRDKVKFLKLDTDKNPELATAMKIYALPTVMFIKDGEILQKSEGALTSSKITAIAEYCFFDGPKPPGLDDTAETVPSQ